MSIVDKFDKLDKIELNESDIAKITIWGSTINKDDFDFNSPMQEGLIIINQSYNFHGKNVDIKAITYFKIHDNGFIIKQYDSSDMVEILSFDIDFDAIEKEKGNVGIVNVKSKWLKSHKDDVMMQCNATMLLIINLFAFMTTVDEVVVSKKETKHITKKQKSKKASKSNSKRIVKVSTIRYTFNFDDSEREHRVYERHVDGWSVRGHWRYIKKSNKWTWVRPHVKGDKENVSPKTYKI